MHMNAMRSMMEAHRAAGRLVCALGSQVPAPCCSPTVQHTRRHTSSTAAEHSADVSGYRWLQQDAKRPDRCQLSWVPPSSNTSSRAADAASASSTSNTSSTSSTTSSSSNRLSTQVHLCPHNSRAGSSAAQRLQQQVLGPLVHTGASPSLLQAEQQPAFTPGGTQHHQAPAVPMFDAGVTGLVPAGVSTLSWPGHGVFFFWQLGVLHALQQQDLHQQQQQQQQQQHTAHSSNQHDHHHQQQQPIAQLHRPQQPLLHPYHQTQSSYTQQYHSHQQQDHQHQHHTSQQYHHHHHNQRQQQQQQGKQQQPQQLHSQPHQPPFLSSYHLTGSSGGSLLAVLAACGVTPSDAMRAAVTLVEDTGIRNGHRGLYGRWKGLLADWLDQLLPPDAAVTCSTRVTLLTTAMPWLYTQAHTTFSSREDLIEVLLASTHVPWFMDGALAAPLRGGLAIDGNFWHTLRGSTWGLVPDGGGGGGGTLLIEPLHDAALMERVPDLRRFLRGLQLLTPGQVAELYHLGHAWAAGGGLHTLPLHRQPHLVGAGAGAGAAAAAGAAAFPRCSVQPTGSK